MQPIVLKHPIHPDELMKADLLSEILLVGGGVAFVVSLLMVIIAVFGTWLLQS